MSTEHEATEPTADATPDAPLDRGVVIGEGLTTLARWSWRLLLVAGASVVLWWLLAKLWVGVFPVLLALIVATVLWPPTRWLRSKGVPDALAAALVIVGDARAHDDVRTRVAPGERGEDDEAARSDSHQ